MATGAGLAECEQTHGKKKAKCVLTSTGLLMEGVSFKYDPFGRRIYKSSSSGTSIFAYDGDNLIEETNASGAAVARYEPTQNIDEPLAMFRSGATSYYHADGLGSVTSLSNAAGALAQTYAYDSFGKQTSSSGSLTNPFQYTARESDAETGLYYYRARYYDPAAGRFLKEDPVRSPLQPNLYKYSRNSPPNRIDSSGMTDHPYPPGMWGRHRGCQLVGVLSLTLWTSETNKTPTSDWQFAASFQIGPDAGPEEVFGVPSAAITCLWQRTYTAELWGHVLTTYTYKCWSDNCFGHHEWTDHLFQWSVTDLGKTSGTEPTTTHHVGQGAEDETNDVLCATDPRFKPGP
jgi:RHS repeat-associated protein